MAPRIAGFIVCILDECVSLNVLRLYIARLRDVTERSRQSHWPASLNTNNNQCQPPKRIKGGPVFAEYHPSSSPPTTTSTTSTSNHFHIRPSSLPTVCLRWLQLSMPSTSLAGEIRGEHSLSERKGPAVSGMVAKQVRHSTRPSLLPSLHLLAVTRSSPVDLYHAPAVHPG
jgi:hypothetical protein